MLDVKSSFEPESRGKESITLVFSFVYLDKWIFIFYLDVNFWTGFDEEDFFEDFSSWSFLHEMNEI